MNWRWKGRPSLVLLSHICSPDRILRPLMGLGATSVQISRTSQKRVRKNPQQMKHGERKYKECAWCGRPFHVWPYVSKQYNRGKYCSRPCCTELWHTLAKLLAEGRLEAVLAPERARAKAERLARFTASANVDFAELERRYARGVAC
jgi:hypothetical protein